MKIAVSTNGKDLNAEISNVFGRCEYFLIIETDKKEIKKVEVIKNESVQKATGAGISAAQMIAGQGVEAVITQNVGPRAQEVLDQFSIDVYISEGKIEDIVEKLLSNNLKKIE